MLSSDEVALDSFSSKAVSNDDVASTSNYLNYIYSKYEREKDVSKNVEKNMLREELIKIFENDLQLNSINNDDAIISANHDDDVIDMKENLTYSGSCIATEYYSKSPMIDNFFDSKDDQLLTESYYQPSYFTTTTTTKANTTIAEDILPNADKSDHEINSSLNSNVTKLTLENLLAPNLMQQNYYREIIESKAVLSDADLLLYSYMQQKSLNCTNENDPIRLDEYIEINCDDYNNSEVDEYEIVDINNSDYLNIINEKFGSIKFKSNNENKASNDNIEYFKM